MPISSTEWTKTPISSATMGPVRCRSFRPAHRRNKDFIPPVDENSIFRLRSGQNLDFVYSVEDCDLVLVFLKSSALFRNYNIISY